VTIRSITIGLLCVVGLCSVTYFNDKVMRGTLLIGNYLPLAVFGTVFIVLMVINPLLHRIRRRLSLSGRDLSVIMALLLFACYVPGLGLTEAFTPFLMLPHHYQRISPGWQGEPPSIISAQILDERRLAELLREFRTASAETPAGFLWRNLPETARKRLLNDKTSGSAGSDEKAVCLDALNTFINTPEIALALGKRSFPLPAYARHLFDRYGEGLPTEAARAVNRAFIDSVLGGVLTPRRPPVLEYAPPEMLADPAENETEALDGFLSGRSESQAGRVPWSAWKRTLLFWIPLILTVCVAVVGLSLVIHRQWATHERLPYPTIEFLGSVLPEEGAAQGPVFRNRLFWVGTIGVLTVYVNNYAYAWWPEIFIPIPTNFDFSPLLKLFPVFEQSGYYLGTTFKPTIFFTVVGFTYFVASDISLSLGIAPYLFLAIAGVLAGYGVSLQGSLLRPYPESFLLAGSYCAMFLVILYTGRQYYNSVFRRSIGLSVKDRLEGQAVWGARLLIVAMSLFALQLVRVGLTWPFALLYTLIMMAIFVTISRLVAEGGVFWLLPPLYPSAILWGILGAKAVGLEQLTIMGILSSVFLINPGEALMPFVVSAFKLTDNARCKLSKVSAWGSVALVLALAVALPVTLRMQYKYGALISTETWTSRTIPTLAFDAVSAVRNTLSAQGSLAVLDLRSGWSRLLAASPMTNCLAAFIVTFVLVIGFTALRYRFAWWPVHPVMFLVLGTWHSRLLGFSFLIGWFAKRCVTKYGGAAAYQKYKPLMIGLVTGELLGGIIPMIIGAVYYLVRGQPPQQFSIFR